MKTLNFSITNPKVKLTTTMLLIALFIFVACDDKKDVPPPQPDTTPFPFLKVGNE